ncbi:MAG: Adenine deaminase [Candidatus Bipolaricaulis sibiricus]|uniref:Adenine deaminase n=1 Tax=Bipolaricaulis sibiricus TaxID=2501609 RepID=A0A410FT94_BIPS1|nr:MAG: Adenine deaminase [Candidatus Bipolaricaulis sibiricus]
MSSGRLPAAAALSLLLVTLWADVTRDLTAVAAGRRPADLVVRNGRWVNVCSGEVLAGTDVAVLGDRIAYCGPDAGPAIGPNTHVIEAAGRYLVPGLLDAHVHVESSMLTPTEFARAVLPRGTTGVFADPHEITNVLGLRAVQLFLEEAGSLPLKVYVQIPSCVPAVQGLDTPGAEVGPAEVTEGLSWPGVIGLGEVMDYPGVIGGNPYVHAKITAALRAGKVVGGHYASPDLGRPFHAYAAGGPADCHEGTRAEDAVARVRQGMRAILRQGAAWQDLIEGLRAVTELGLDPRRVLLATDDRDARTLLRNGHMDDVVRTAIAVGVPPVTVIAMATLNTAEHFGLDRDVGAIAPGRVADILIVSDLEQFTVDTVIASGRVVARAGELQVPLPRFPYPDWARGTVRLDRPLSASDFAIRAPIATGDVEVRAIELIEHQAPTRERRVRLPVHHGQVATPPEVARVAVVERHCGSGRIGHGLLVGLGLKPGCAVASTVAHDSHHLLIVGTNPEAMARAANHVARVGGGIAVVRGEEVVAFLPLPIAGLLSDRPAEEVAAGLATVHAALRACGVRLADGLMTLSLLALPVIPALRVTDRGLVDVERGEIVSPFV